MSYKVSDNNLDNEKNTRILYYYEQFANAINAGVRIDDIKLILIKDIKSYVTNIDKEKDIKNPPKMLVLDKEEAVKDYIARNNSEILDNQSAINNIDDLSCSIKAFIEIQKKYNIFINNGKNKKNFFDYCLEEKIEFDKMIDDGINIDNIEFMFNYDYRVYSDNHTISLDSAINKTKDLVLNKDEIENFALEAFARAYNNPATINKKNYLNKKIALSLIKQQINNN